MECLDNFIKKNKKEDFHKIYLEHPGEQEDLDFKKKWPDSESLAKHVVGMANTKGGCIVIGVEEKKGTKEKMYTGLEKFEESSDIKEKLSTFIPECLKRNIRIVDLDYKNPAEDFSGLNEKLFQVLIVDYCPDFLPFMTEKDGKKVINNGIYVRCGASTRYATYQDIQELIRRRIEAERTSFEGIEMKKNLANLKELKNFSEVPFLVSVPTILDQYGINKFIHDMIKKQKKVIENNIKWK